MLTRAAILLSLSVSSLAACSGGDGSPSADAAPPAIDAAPAPDDATPADAAPPSAFSCVGAELPTTAEDPVEVSGQTVALQLAALAPKEGVSVSAFVTGTANAIAGPDVSGSDGQFSLSAPTGGQPLDAYLVATLEGYLDTYLYPPTDVTSDLIGATVPVFTQENMELLSGFAQVLLEPGTGNMVVALLDCEGAPVPGAVVTSSGGQVVYLADTGFPDSTRTSTSALGIAVVFNVPPGTVTLSAVRGDVSLRTNDVVAYDGAVTATLIGP